MLISHTMIKGIPLVVDFSHTSGSALANPPSHSTYEHFLFSHFKLNEGNPVNAEHYIWLNPFEGKAKEHLKKAAISTGAFPVGLLFREFDKLDFNAEYIKNVLSRVIKKNLGELEPDIKSKIHWDEESLENYKSVTVDGGTINNEPYAEVLSILEHRYNNATVKVDGKDYQKYGMVMIDPFPDFYYLRTSGKYPEDIMGVAPSIIGTLWDQAKIKRNEIIQQFENDAYRGVIFPIKYDRKENKYKNPLSCGALQAFSGFLDIKFRHHDFFLGRNNARNFIRAYLSVPYDPDKGIIHPLHRDQFWTEKMRERFKIKFKGTDGYYLPLIPDMNLLIDGIESSSEIYRYDVPEIPQISEDKIKELKDKIYFRSSAIMSHILDLPFETKRKKTNVFSRIGGKIFSLLDRRIKIILRTYAANLASEKTIQWFVEELKDVGLIEGSEQKIESKK